MQRNRKIIDWEVPLALLRVGPRYRYLRIEVLEDRKLLTLLGLAPTLPLTTYNGNLTYDASTHSFDLSAIPLRFRQDASSPQRVITGTANVSIHIQVDNAGNLIGGVAGDDFVLSGTIDLNGDGTPDVSGTLLTGEIRQFGFQDSGTATDAFDFDFTPTGGQLLSDFTGQDIGVTTDSEGSTFTNFSSNFQGGAKGVIGATPVPGSLSGFVYSDANNDGVFQNTETPIANTTVTLTGTDVNGTPVNLVTTTDATGLYKFSNLQPGTYTISETQPAGYLDGEDTIGTPGGTTTNDQFSNITLGSGVNGVNNNFGEVLPASLAGFVYVDVNNDGVFQNTETPIANTTVTLTGTDDLGNAVNTSTTTNASGAYNFANLRPGNYTLSETQPAGYLDGKDTIGTPGGTTTNDQFSNIALGSGVDGVNNNFGEVLPASLAGFVYVDANDDGVFQGTETPIANTTVTLTGTDDLGNAVNTSTTTNASGAYNFANLRPGNYTLSETQPSAYLDGKDTIGTPGGTTTNDQFSNIALGSGVNGVNNNFGELLPASLAGFVYVDANDDGVFQNTETPIANTTVTLTGTDDLGNAVNTSTTTNASGAYSFTNLRPGNYTLSETQPSAYLDGKDTIGTPGGTTTNDQFSNIALGSGVNGVNNNFGELLPASLAGYVYVDVNNDGVFQNTETPIANTTVTLTGTDDLGNAVNTSTTTNASGAYSFTNLRPGNYTLSETQPSAYLDGKDTIGTPGGTTTNDQFSNITLGSGVDGVNNNFGEVLPASLAGFVYVDANNDGVFQNTESPISGVTVTLTGTDDLGNAVNTSTTTNASGAYSFTNLRPGNYTLSETQPSAYLDGKDTIGTPGGTTTNDQFSSIALGSGVNGVNNNFGELLPASLAGFVYVDSNDDGVFQNTETPISGVTVTLTGTDDNGNAVNTSTTTDSSGAYNFTNLRPGNYTLSETQPSAYLDGKDTIGTPGGTTSNDQFSSIALGSGVNGVNNNFGEIQPGSLAGFVYIDANDDGVFETGETPIPGVTITLTGTDDRGNPVNASMTTGADGGYNFTNLRPGTYTITETQPGGYLNGKDTIGTPGGVTSSDQFSHVVLGQAIDGVNNIFGELLPPQSNVPPGVTFNPSDDVPFTSPTLPTGLAGALPASSVTPAVAALLNNLLQGTTPTRTADYYLAVQPPDDPPVDSTVQEVLKPIDDDLLASLSGYVYWDANDDGLFQDLEMPISGVKITLSGTDDHGAAVGKSTSTDAAGYYVFAELRPGTYAINESQPSDYLDGKDTIGTPGGNTGNDNFSNIKLAAGVHGVNNNFGELMPASLAGYVYADDNDNGLFDDDELPIPGVTLNLSGTDDLGHSVDLSTTTDQKGLYRFTNLRPGTYSVSESQPLEYADGKLTVGNKGGTAGDDVFTDIVLGSGEDGIDYNFGEHELPQ